MLRDLHRASKQEYLELSERLGDSFDLTQTGLVMLCSTPEGLEVEAAVAAAEPRRRTRLSLLGQKAWPIRLTQPPNPAGLGGLS